MFAAIIISTFIFSRCQDRRKKCIACITISIFKMNETLNKTLLDKMNQYYYIMH